MPDFRVEPATEGDMPQVLRNIKLIAEEDGESGRVVCSAEKLVQQILVNQYSHCLVAKYLGDPNGKSPIAGHLMYSFSLSTDLGKPTIFVIEDWVHPEYRNRGAGRALFAELARIAFRKKCGRIDARVLKWDKYSVGFYRNVLKAQIQTDCEFIRLEGNDQIGRVAELAD